jgi:dolichol-phosphate mannosyltransferase
VLAELYSRAVATGADLVVASRYTEFGRSSGLSSVVRMVVSRAATLAAKLVFPSMLRGVTDPMSGYFLVRSRALRLEGVQPNGFKILLELLATMVQPRISEVPFVFDARHAGDSKANPREGLRFLGQLARLRLATYRHGGVLMRFAVFGVVGAGGLLVNTGVFAAAVGVSLPYLVAAFFATQVATTFNFVMSERFVFAGRVPGGRRWMRLLKFFAVADLGFAISGPLMMALIVVARIAPVAANLLAIVLLTVGRFVVADKQIWSSAVSKPLQLGEMLVNDARDVAAVGVDSMRP